MESLPPKTQEQIKKMSTEYLVLKLTKAGLDEEVILKMSREQLMAAWADLVAAGKDKPAAAAVAVGTKSHVAYDPELEKQRLQFEMRKYDEDKAERLRQEEKAERLRQEEKVEAERLRQEEKAESLRQEEKAERLRQLEYCEWQKTQAVEAKKLQDEQFIWQQTQADIDLAKRDELFAWQQAKDEREKAKQESVAAQLKLYGDIV